jgi:hypothetical protein
VLSILYLGEVVFAIWTGLDVKYFHLLSHVHSTGSVTVFNGILKREVMTRLAGIFNYVQERQCMQQIYIDKSPIRVQERQLCAALATDLNSTVCIPGLWPN